MPGFTSLIQRLVAPNPKVTDPQARARAQLVNILSLILLLLSAIALPFVSSNSVFLIIGGASFLSYLLGKSAYYFIGAHLISYSLAATGFIRIYSGSSTTIESAINTSVYISLILAGLLLSNAEFIVFTILISIATVASPSFSTIPVNGLDNPTRAAGILLVTGCLLFGMNVLRSYLESQRLNEISNTNKELKSIRDNLEVRIQERTAELREAYSKIENRASRLQTVEELSRLISANIEQDLKNLMTSITEQTSTRMNYYHVGLFLLDDRKEYAILQAANSEGGQVMLKRHHQLKVGGTGIVGYAAQSGRPRVALDTGTDAVFFNNPDLPETRSEVALPLKVGSEVIGVLDVQSTEPNAFGNEDVTALGALANHIAIVIQNIQLAEGSSRTTRGFLRIERYLNPRSRSNGFTYLPDGSIASEANLQPSTIEGVMQFGEPVIKNTQDNETHSMLAIPVKVRDVVIGIIHIEAAQGNRKWSEDEILLAQSISERAALAIENARLFEETERLAAQDRVIAQVTARIGDSSNMERILHTTIQELGRTLGAKRTFIQLSASGTNGSSEHSEE